MPLHRSLASQLLLDCSVEGSGDAVCMLYCSPLAQGGQVPGRKHPPLQLLLFKLAGTWLMLVTGCSVNLSVDQQLQWIFPGLDTAALTSPLTCKGQYGIEAPLPPSLGTLCCVSAQRWILCRKQPCRVSRSHLDWSF